MALNTAVAVASDIVTATVIGGTDVTALTVAGEIWKLDILVVLSNGEKVRGRVPLRVDV